MATPLDSKLHRSGYIGMGRLFNFDVPDMQKTGNVFPEQADLSTVHRVLDVACGSGEWAIAAAQAYPRMQIVGVDRSETLINNARIQAHTCGLDNISFHVLNPFQALDVPDASFDLVNVRFIVGFTPIAVWPTLISQCLRTLRPGGIIRLTEGDTPISNSPAFERLTDLICRALGLAGHNLFPALESGQNLLITPLLEQVLRTAGCADVSTIAVVTNFSAGTEAHTILAPDFAQTYQLAQPFVIEMGITTQQEVERVYQQMLIEMRSDQFCAVGFYLTVWGAR